MSKSPKTRSTRSKQTPAPVVELPADAPDLSLRLLQLATALRQPDADRYLCADELDTLAARATWSTEITQRQRDLTLKLSIAADETAKLAVKAHVLAVQAAHLLEGAHR